MNKLDIVRYAIMSAQKGLPLEYEYLEYLQSDGRQYIDLEYVPKTNSGRTEIIAEASNISGTIGIWGYIQTNIIANRISIGLSQSIWFCGVGATKFGPYVQKDTKTSIVFDRFKQSMYINNVEYTYTPSPANVTKNAYLFGRNDGFNSLYGTSFSGKIYEFKEYNEDRQLMCHLVPARRKDSGKVGMYDLVRRKFYTNKGTGEFNVNEVEVESYTRIEYIESNGYQWIDTLIPNTLDLIFEDRFMVTAISTPFGDGSWIIGGRLNYNYGFGIFRGTSGFFNAYGGPTKSTTLTNVQPNIWVDMYFSRFELTTTTPDGVVMSYTVQGQKLIPAAYETNILLGKNQVNYQGTGNDPRNMLGRRASTRITNAVTGSLLRDFIPVRLNISGRVGMWDMVSNTFFGSMGTREFTAGPDL